MDAGTIEKALPGLEHVTVEPTLKPGHAIPLTPLLWFGPLWTQSFEVYSPWLDPINDRVVRPVASAIVKGVSAVSSGIEKAWRARGRYRRDLAGFVEAEVPAGRIL